MVFACFDGGIEIASRQINRTQQINTTKQGTEEGIRVFLSSDIGSSPMKDAGITVVGKWARRTNAFSFLLSNSKFAPVWIVVVDLAIHL